MGEGVTKSKGSETDENGNALRREERNSEEEEEKDVTGTQVN